MFRKLIVLLIAFCFAWIYIGVSLATDPAQAQQQGKAYGWNFMTPEERAEHQAKMRSFELRRSVNNIALNTIIR